MKPSQIIRAICLLLILSRLEVTAYATDQPDIAVALKTLPLLTTKMIGETNVAIIFDPASPASQTDAEKINAILNGDIEAPGNIKLITQMISVNDLSKLTISKIAFLAHGLTPQDYKTITIWSSANSVLTISSDLDCVKYNQCVLGISSSPRVEVYYSPVAAENAKINFASSFVMLAKQVGGM